MLPALSEVLDDAVVMRSGVLGGWKEGLFGWVAEMQ